MQFMRFALVGAAGLVVDTLVLYLALGIGLGAVWGRLISFLTAAFFTWKFNRRYTFVGKQDGTEKNLKTELARYLAAMSWGGAVNLVVYSLVMGVTSPHPARPMLAVALGSAAGLGFNFASAKWWVYQPRTSSQQSALFKIASIDLWLAVLVQLLFWTSHLRMVDLPGLYMDAVNPDYLAAQILNREIANPSMAMPSVIGPILGGLYHGAQNLLLGLPVFSLLGFNLLSLRVAQGLFGAGILILMQALIKRMTGSTAIAIVCALALASELAFVASFRTQNYIVISGCLWLLAAMYVATQRGADRRLLLFSGALMGLAVYSYFVFLFFVPAWIVCGLWNTRSIRSVGAWLLGLALGLQTYVLGYLSLVLKLGGLGNAVQWLQQMLGVLAPMSSGLNWTDRFHYAWLYARMSAHNWSNEQMLMETVVSGSWAEFKFGLFLACAVVLMLVTPRFLMITTLHEPAANYRHKPAFVSCRQLGWWLLSFWVCALFFGKRMGAHHYVSWVPLLYVLLACTAADLSRWLDRKGMQLLPIVAVLLIVALNQQQQQPFFKRLTETGGVGKASNAINRLAEDAMSLSPAVVHVFPDWGFMMPFNFLTGNQRRYVLDLSDSTMFQLREQRSPIRVAFWSEADAVKHRKALEAAGYQVTRIEPYLQRDQRPAFWLLQAHLP